MRCHVSISCLEFPAHGNDSAHCLSLETKNVLDQCKEAKLDYGLHCIAIPIEHETMLIYSVKCSTEISLPFFGQRAPEKVHVFPLQGIAVRLVGQRLDGGGIPNCMTSGYRDGNSTGRT